MLPVLRHDKYELGDQSGIHNIRVLMEQVIYGINPVIEALKAPQVKLKEILIAQNRRRHLERILQLAEEQHVRIRYQEKNDLTAFAKARFHQGVVAVVERYRYAPLEEILAQWKKSGLRALILVLDSIQDPQNLGAMIRTANVCGAHGVIIPRDRAASVTPTVVKASAGATAFTPVARVTNITSTLERLKEEGVWIVGAAAESEISLFEEDLSVDLAMIIGSEGRGIRPRVLGTCDLTVSIPMGGQIASLNASVATGVILYEVIRQRLCDKKEGK
jgi:23S rRNA (guanosine2251-2'-O)-methyltransferase